MHNYPKLVRDRIPELIRRNGGAPQTRRLSDEEFAAALARKLVEEAEEFAATPTAEELADVLEVVYALAGRIGISIDQVETIRRAKAAERGTFDKRLLLESVSSPSQPPEDVQPTPAELLNVGRVALGAAAAIFDEDGRILLVRHSYGRLNWELPGGVAQSGESPEQTAVREVAEETGLMVVPQRVTGIYSEPGHRLGASMHFVLRCRREPGDAEPRIASDEIIDLAWVEPATLPRPISDFTVRRITDAMANAPLLPALVAARTWFENEQDVR